MRDIKYDPKDPDDVDNFQLDWKKRVKDPDVIVDSTAAPAEGDESGVVIVSQNYIGTVQTVRVSGGIPGTTARITCHIVTAEGLEWDRTFQTRIKEA